MGRSGFPDGGAIGRNSNLGHLSEKWADLRKRIKESPARPPLSAQDSPNPRSKRFLTALDIADIVQQYEVGQTTPQIGNRYNISKSRVAMVLRENKRHDPPPRSHCRTGQ